MTGPDLKAILSCWNITFDVLRKDLSIAGSPERTQWRGVVNDTRGTLYVLENVSARLTAHKRMVAQILNTLQRNGLTQIAPYLFLTERESLAEVNGKFWQIAPYIPGKPLDRPYYVMDPWIGDAAAAFLIALRKASEDKRNFPDKMNAFDLRSYIDLLTATIYKRRPELRTMIAPQYEYVRSRLYPVLDIMPKDLCHGDFHALNIIWNERALNCVIDWEFTGIKPELFDAANMVSCLGIEDPQSLWQGAVVPFIRTLKGSGLYAPVSLKHFFPLLIAIRFAWISEWLRKNDDDMLQMESDYFEVLTSNEDYLLNCWDLA